MRVAAAILCAGSGLRFGRDKTLVTLRGRPLWRASFSVFASHPSVADVFIVGSAENCGSFEDARVVLGGATRSESVRAALAATEADVLLVHDGARPFVDAATIDRVLDGIRSCGAAAACVPVTDTIRSRTAGSLDRDGLVAMQTPQGATTERFRAALALGDATDDVTLLERTGPVLLVDGSPDNVKITHPGDLPPAETRVGFGYDVHAYSDDPARVLMIGGVAFPGERALEGHSDADALLHALTDAVLGAAAMGDIGVHFPPSDERWRGAASLGFLRHAAGLVRAEGWTVVNVDMTVVAESPKIMRRSAEIRTAIAKALGIDVSRVSVKATTNERLGFVGRREGLAATAVATLSR